MTLQILLKLLLAFILPAHIIQKIQITKHTNATARKKL